MTGRAEVVDHVFRWETDFAFPWMEGWAKNQQRAARAQHRVRDPRQEPRRGGDHGRPLRHRVHGGRLRRRARRRRAARAGRGADDNHSATTALLLAAEQLLPLARAGKLERDVWLVHLTGEEFPADCLGARALCQALVERRLAFTAEDGSPRDVSHVDVVGAFVLDMIGHNTERDRDVFQIAPGEGRGGGAAGAARPRANQRWNRGAAEWNRAPGRHGRAARSACPTTAPAPPPPFAHLPLHGEVRVEWEPRSALYNTDGQIFSDVGVPVVLFMENYDISRTGYHDTHDTMANIDLDT